MFEPGMLVECIDDEDHPELENPHFLYVGDLGELRRGHVYTVRFVYIDTDDGNLIVLLEEIQRPKRTNELCETGYLAIRFRPLRDERLAIFRSLLAPSPEQVAEYDAERIEEAAKDVERATEELERSWGGRDAV